MINQKQLMFLIASIFILSCEPTSEVCECDEIYASRDGLSYRTQIDTSKTDQVFTGICYSKDFEGLPVEEKEYYKGRITRSVAYRKGIKVHQVSFDWEKNTRRIIRWYFYGGLFLEEGFIEDNLQHGKKTIWQKDGIQYWEGLYEKGKLKSFTKWYNNGNKQVTGNYENDVRLGTWQYWYENGDKLCTVTFERGAIETSHVQIEDSVQMTYHYNGHIEKLVFFEGDQKNGPVIQWYNNGVEKFRGYYKNNKADSLWTEYYRTEHAELMLSSGDEDNWVDGIKSEEGMYKNGEKEGNWKFWNRDGSIKFDVTYKEGRLQVDNDVL